MRRLDLLVPHWRETPGEMEPLLDSIRAQRAVDLSDVGVIIAFDGPDATELPLSEWRERYPFAIEDVHPKKAGVSHARNAALDASEAEYVMFCDADDCLFDSRGLYIVFREMGPEDAPDGGFDFLLCDFIEEVRRDGRIEYEPHVNNSTFVHSQVMRRRWMAENGIRSCDRLTVHEDSYLVTLARTVARPERTKWCRYPWYLWCWRDASVCRHDDRYILKTYDDMLESSDALVGELMRRGMLREAQAHAVAMIWDAYYTLNKPEWRDVGNASYRATVEARARAYLRRWREHWDTMEPHARMAMSEAVRSRAISGGLVDEAKTPAAWVGEMLGSGARSRRRKGRRR